MKKIFLLCLTFIYISIISLTACSGGKKNTTSTDTSTDSADTSDVISTLSAETTELNNADFVDYDPGKYIVLGKYTGIEIDVEDTTVTDEEFKYKIEKTRYESSTSTKVVTNRGAKKWDTVNIDYEGLLAGVPFSGGTGNDYDLTLGTNTFINGFEDGLIGAKIGEKVSINLTFPEAYKSAELAGKAVVFNVTVNSITENVLPEYNDTFVKSVSECSTVAEYEEYIKKTLSDEKKAAIQKQKESDVWKIVVKNAKVNSYPESRIKEFTDQMDKYYTDRAASNSQTLEQYLAANSTDLSGYTSKAIETAQNNILSEMLVLLIADKENITLNDEDYSTYRNEYVASLGFSDVTQFESYYSKSFSQAFDDEAMDLYFLSLKVQKFCADKAIEK